ncbi:MAG: alkaline phosphatase family protein [Pirellulaceae bacterium]
MQKKRKVLLVGWDAADWKVISPLVDAGVMPNVARLIETGVMGNLATLNPILSPMLWTSIATGKRPYKHGIHGFSEPDPDSGTIRPITNLSRKTKAIWNILNQHGKKSLVVGWWPSSPAEPINGAMVSNHFQQAVSPLGKPWPMRLGTVYPASLTKELAPLRIHPHELEGDMLRNFVPRAPEIDQQKDKRLATVAKIFAECSSIHAAATHLIQTTPDWDFAAVYYDAIDHFGHGFMKYHPPKLDWVSEEDFDLYKDVINGGYIYHDMMLGALLNAVGQDTTVILISDHGFHPDHLRPKSLPNEPAGPAAEHRQFGIFVANGPDIKEDELVFGASLLDVTPTILSLFGLPVGRDMDGRALTSIYKESINQLPPSVEYVDSWDAVVGEDGRHPPETRMNPVDAQEAIRQLVDLGYIDEPDEDRSKAIEETNRELQYNLARAYVDGGKFYEAAALFSQLWQRWPHESRFGVHLLQTQLKLDVLAARETMTLLRERKKQASQSSAEELNALLEKLCEQHPAVKDEPHQGATADGGLVGDNSKYDHIDWEQVKDRDKRRLKKLRSGAGVNPRAFAFLEGSLLHLEGCYDEALAMLSQAASAQTANLPSLFLQMGEVCVSMRKWDSARQNFGRVVELDPLNANAHYGLARVALNQKDWQTASAEALTAAGQHYHYAPAHYVAGLALWRLGKTNAALEALQRAVAINPVFPAAHRTLATLFRKEMGNWAAHDHHLKLARQAKQRLAKRIAVGVPEKLYGQDFDETFGRDMEFASPQVSITPPQLRPREESIVIVTGLPRTGTSMMMQMLQAGGVPVLVDDHRQSDESNQRGYFEHEDAKRTATDSGWISAAKGKAVKIVVQLLKDLPPENHYRIVFMHRPLVEVVSSQKKMLGRLGKAGASITEEALQRTYSQQVKQVRFLLNHCRGLGLLDFVDVKYHDALTDPISVATQLAEFIGGEFNIKEAANAVAPSLRHETS